MCWVCRCPGDRVLPWVPRSETRVTRVTWTQGLRISLPLCGVNIQRTGRPGLWSRQAVGMPGLP